MALFNNKNNEMKIFVLKAKYNDDWYFEEIREKYYTRWNHTVMGTEATFRIVR